MGTKISSVPDCAGVTCPKETGLMDKSEPCSACKHYTRCAAALFSHLVEDT